METKSPTPRATRHRLNKMEGWFRGNQSRFTPTDQVVIRSLFEIADTPSDVVNMGEALRERVRPETQDRVELIAEHPQKPLASRASIKA